MEPTEMTQHTELKPCKCGGEGNIMMHSNHKWAFAFCNEPKCGNETEWKVSRKEAVAAWNRRK